MDTLQLPDGNRTSDRRVADVADAEDRVVVSKDRDFRNDHLLIGSPRRLLLVSTGNTANDELLALFDKHLEALLTAFTSSPFVEMYADLLVVHQGPTT